LIKNLIAQSGQPVDTQGEELASDAAAMNKGISSALIILRGIGGHIMSGGTIILNAGRRRETFVKDRAQNQALNQEVGIEGADNPDDEGFVGIAPAGI